MTSMQRSTPGKDGKMIMDKAWEKVQQKTFTKWVNSHLRKRGKDAIIEDIQTDFNDGLKLIQFLEVISTKNDWSKRYDKKPRMKIQKIQNVDMCMKFLKSEGVKLVAIQAENIIDGDLTLILGMIWTIIQQYQIADISEEELTAKEALLLWCQKKTKGYEGVDPPGIKNFHTNWADGLALCALIHRHRPDLLDYSKCDKSTPRENCKLAFEVAEEKLGIPQLLDVEDLCDTAKPDERSVITYVVQYYHVFAASQKGEVAGRRVGKLVDFERAVEKLRNEYNERAAALVKWIEAKLEWLEDRELGETEDEIAAKLAEYNQYRQTEKPEKAAEKAGVEALFNSIQVKLSSNDRPAFVPADGCAPGAINELWAKLLEAEHAKELALRGARKREKELALLNSRLDDKAARLAAWIEKSEAYLAREESVASVGAAQSKLLELEAWQGEYADAKPRVAELHDLAAQIAALNAPNAADAKARADDLGGRYDALAGAADAKKAALDAALKLEQDKEAARIAWAKAAKEYVRWTKAACESADDDRYFGDSVDAVNGDKARVDAAAEATGADNAAKKAVVDECWAALEALGVADNNRYSSLTRADTDAASERVGAAVEARAAAWADALAAEEAKEAKRKEFAAAAAAFNEAVEARRAALTAAAAEGEPAAACEQLDAVYDGGAPEQAALAALAALHDECTALGITSNRHTRDNNASLTARAARLGRFVESKKAALRREEALKSDYETRARALLAWRDGAAPGIESRDISNSLEDAREQRAVFQTYRTNEKAEKVNEKVALSKLAKQIARVLEKNSRPPFAPADDVAQASVVKAFLELDKAEAAKADFLAQYLARMEELDLLAKRFAGDERDLQAWLDEKEAYVAETAAIDSLMRGQYAKVVHHSYDEEYAHRAERVAALTGLAAEIAALDHADKAQIEAQAAAVQARYDALKASADSKRDAIDAALKLEQEKEDARIAYAGAATDLERHAAEAVAAIADRTFGFTLDAVSAHADVLAASDADATAAVDERHAAVAAAAKQCDELACGENAHTALTPGDADASRQAVVDALAARRADYDAELGKQQRWDAARLAFAADADAFVAWLAEQRKAVGATEGDADARTAAIRAIHQDGAPGAAKVGELRASADAMRADGVVGNEHTGLTVPLLEARNAQFDRFVASALANIEDEKEAEAKEAEAAAAAAAAEQKEQEQFDFQKAAKVLLNWLASAGAFLTEPIAAASVDEVDALKAELAAFNEQLAQREPDYADLEGKAATVNDGSLFDALRAKWAESKELAAKRAADLDAERAAQEANEALRVAFAEQATALRAFIDAQSGKLAATSGDLAAQKDALAALAAENAGGEAQVEATQAAQVALDDAGVNDNPHTNLTADQLQREYKSLLDATSEKQKLVDEELAAKADSGVSPAQIAEWRAVFSHFDKDKSQTLQDYELRACLNSLGDDPSDAELKSIVDKFKNADKGQVDFEGFQQLMLERNTDSQTQESSLDNWRVIAGDKDFVTEQDMAMAGMEPSHVEYLKSVMPKNDDGYDYKTWTEGCFAN